MKKPHPILFSIKCLAAALIGTSSIAVASPAVTLKAQVDRPVLLTNSELPQSVVIQVDLEGAKREDADKKRIPLHLAIVLDRSGSMSGAKLEQAKQAAEMLIHRLAPTDVFSVVTYDSDAEVLIPARLAGHRIDDTVRKLRRIKPGGSTALYAGVKLGGKELKDCVGGDESAMVRRVLLLSDGLANIGPDSNREITTLGRQLADDGVSVTTIGLGADYNEDLMVSLAEASDANFYHVQDVEMLADVFNREIGELQDIVAREIRIVIDCPTGITPIRILGRAEQFDRKGEIVIPMETIASGQQRQLLIECEVGAGFEAETLAQIEVDFKEATEDGSRAKVEQQVAIKTTSDKEVADQAINHEILIAAEIYRNAAATDEAIALADANDIAGAKKKFDRQVTTLRELQKDAPPALAKELEEEAQVLIFNSGNLETEGFSKQERKALKSNIFNYGNNRKAVSSGK